LKLRFHFVPATLSVVLLLLPLATAQIPQLTPFSADMQVSSTHANGAHETDGKIFITRDHMRMEMQGGPRGQVIMITTFSTKTTDMLMPEHHMYMEFKADESQTRRAAMMPSVKPFTDPSNPCANSEGSTCKNMGVEDVNGRSCVHWEITDKNGKVSNVWIDQKLHFPIKTVSSDSTWQLTNIKEGQPDASLFEIPTGYQKMDMGGMMQGMRPPQQ
jgi:outer membrane lipoprotein-sorting protein